MILKRYLVVRGELVERDELVSVWDVGGSDAVEVEDHRVLEAIVLK